MKQIDLHTHSTQSDGTLSPTELVRHAAACHLTAFALTDHDTTDGLAEAFAAAADYSIKVIPGIEFSTEYHDQDIHILALDPDWKHPDFQAKLQDCREERARRNQKMIDLMAADGIDISYDKMLAAFPRLPWTRTHFGRYLADHGYVKNLWDAFDTHIGVDCPYYVPRDRISPSEAVRLIRQFHGIPVLAHPYQYQFSKEELSFLLQTLKEDGLLGMEVYYSTYSAEQMAQLAALADQFQLAPSGGSDFHGTNKPDIELGSGKNNLQIPYQILEGLREKRKEVEG